MRKQLATTGFGLMLLATASWAAPGHNDHSPAVKGDSAVVQDHSHGAQDHATVAGRPGDLGSVNRTIAVAAFDTMKFEHEPLVVKAGETVRFEVTNHGQVPHEFAIASQQEHAVHRVQMREMPDMKHEDPNLVMLEPGERKELVWTFAQAGAIQAACNIPGHYEAGMYSEVQVK